MVCSLKKAEISFRNAVPEIPSNAYGVFSLYKYPAKFIPQVVAYILKNFAKPNMRVFDPFAGHGTVGFVSRIYGCNYELWDLNPLLSVIHDTAIADEPKEFDPLKLILDIKKCEYEFIPKWSNLEYWFPKEFLPLLFKAWGYVYSLEDNTIKNLLLIPLLKVTKYFSCSDEDLNRLHKSKFAKRKIENLLKSDWESLFFKMLEEKIRSLIKKRSEYRLLNPKPVEYKVKSGIDTLQTNLENEVDILITSPPYLQAQKYINTTKLELFWLGYDEEFIRELYRKEIPYRHVDEIKIYSETYYKFRELIKEHRLIKLYDRYFHAILKTFSTLGEKVKEYMFILVGHASIRTIPIPIDDIITEHLIELGWKHEITLIDKVLAHSFFKARINPATGLKNNRIETEYLVVLRRNK